VVVLSAGRLKVFNSLGFIALIVFIAVLLTSVSLSSPAERNPFVTEFSLAHTPKTPAAKHNKQPAYQQPPAD
jgi:hypothetical protein